MAGIKSEKIYTEKEIKFKDVEIAVKISRNFCNSHGDLIDKLISNFIETDLENLKEKIVSGYYTKDEKECL